MSESEVVGVVRPASGSFREDSTNYRLWQVAGASHNDTWGNNYWLLTQMPRDWLGLPVGWNEKRNGRYGEHAGPGACDLRLSRTNQFPQRYSFAAALAHLERWVRGEGAPPPMPRLQLDARGKPVRDAYGNALGGIRYPFVDVPVATYSGDGGCALTGWTRPLDDATLRSLYPTHEHYVEAMTAAATAARDAGLLLDFDFADVVARVAVAPVPRPGASTRLLIPPFAVPFGRSAGNTVGVDRFPETELTSACTSSAMPSPGCDHRNDRREFWRVAKLGLDDLPGLSNFECQERTAMSFSLDQLLEASGDILPSRIDAQHPARLPVPAQCLRIEPTRRLAAPHRF